MKWQPIETAPDDVDVLVCFPFGYDPHDLDGTDETWTEVMIAHKSGGRWWHSALWDDFKSQLSVPLTHWCPFPEPPDA